MYAVVDIETTGGHPSANGITEIAIVVYDGEQVIHQYQTLINPGVPIPIYISALTGISNEMVQSAPTFNDVAQEVFLLLHDKIFVAHNVNFDYSFLKYHLGLAGYDLQCKKLCTVRLGRKIFPGLLSYSLGKFCSQMNIKIENRHRAGGDALATSTLFAMMLQNDMEGHIAASLKYSSKEQVLPPNLDRKDFDSLPKCAGVYYFLDQKGKVIYVGKAKNLRKRVASHFSGNNAGKQRQDFLKHIHGIRFEACATELMSFILEAVEIKRLWPQNNRALKRFDQAYGIYLYEDQKGYQRLVLDKRRKYSAPVYSFNSILEGHNLIVQLMKTHQLCPKLCFVQKNNDACIGLAEAHCFGACEGREDPATYNLRTAAALQYLKSSLPSLLIQDDGQHPGEQSVVLMEEGKLTGMGCVPIDFSLHNITELKNYLRPYPSNDYIRNIILSHASRYPHKVTVLNSSIADSA
ncbi:exonuclease domain-containing protein [Pedobacter sp. SYSU D00535]|uniref:exonuclease domain-containing protein n=1 Tax=Pedobacter sp. SYSU D00535 TaxID=2810308 RepID=UPI001A969242|nr:exonuclease domain-containing protein [Pedobacter sp. SYSU D00535]